MSTWAIIKTGGKQYKVEEGQKLAVEKLSVGDKKELAFEEILLISNDKGLTLGNPLIGKARVKAKIVGDFKDKKIRVVKFKSKSKYLRTTGHRQSRTSVIIEKIVLQ